jgi:small subunit ribosomal protein S20
VANTRSAIKRVRSSERKQVQNRAVRSATRTYVKKARLLIEDGDTTQSPAAVQEAIKMLDRAGAKGILHRNNIARRKSRLLKHLHEMQP